ncbi:hypothetical protein P7B02_16125 [Caulobacter segnis]|uniref:hypothetical protein n=1 Tax=Caulobacter segnis TaxID=88688 RepID=UPI00240EA419|nr:hypothetical protein [Caulobacter segnis]MDG2523064.1 hypothetical protein [Caulobacter segnis]
MAKIGIGVDRRWVSAGLLALLGGGRVHAQVKGPSAEALMTASYKAGRFNSAKFQAQLQLTGQGAPRVRELSGASRPWSSACSRRFSCFRSWCGCGGPASG